MTEIISFLIGPILASIVSLFFFLVVRRETRKAAADLERMKDDVHSQVEEQIRRLQTASARSSNVPLASHQKSHADAP